MYKEDRRMWLEIQQKQAQQEQVPPQQQQQLQQQQQQKEKEKKQQQSPQYPHLQFQRLHPPPSSIIKPRPILMDKNYASEPNTPIVRNPNKPMHRNLSDLGPRIKKRVTYRCLSDGSDLEDKLSSISRSVGKLSVPDECPSQDDNDNDSPLNSLQGSPRLDHLSECNTDTEYISDAESVTSQDEQTIRKEQTTENSTAAENKMAASTSDCPATLKVEATETRTLRPADNSHVLVRPEILKLRKTMC
jgi:hypothetical protein